MVGLGRDEPDLVGQPVGVDQSPDAGELGPAVVTARAADDDEQGVGPAAGDLGEGTDGDVEALEGLDAPDEQQDGAAGLQTEGGAGAALVTGREEGVQHPRGDDLDPGGVGAVVSDEVVGLGRARRRDRVGAGDDLGLGVDPALRLGIAGLRLHPGERVERRHERQVELVLEPVTGHAREPVVGVDGVEGARAEVGEDALGELVDGAGQVLLREVDGPSGDVDDPHARLDVHDLGQVWCRGPGEDVDGDARLRERRSQLAHVDVHAAAVALAWLGQGRRVHREHRQGAHLRAGTLPSGLIVPDVVAVAVLVAERLVDANQGLLLVLAEERVPTDLPGQVGGRLRAPRGCRPGRRGSRPRSRAHGRSAGGSRPTACAGRARSGSGTGWRCRRAPRACEARGDRPGVGRG